MEKGVIDKNGIYWLDYRFDGRRMRKKIGSSKKLAETVMQKIRVQIAEGKYLDVKKEEKKINFNDFAQIYANTYGEKKRSWSSTDKLYLVRLKAFFGSKNLDEITPLFVQKYRIARREQKTRRHTRKTTAASVSLKKTN